MPVDSRHPEYEKNLPIWEQNRDARDGESAVKAKKEKYLSRLSGHKIKYVDNIGLRDTYDPYLRRAMLPPFTGRTAEGMRGLAFRKPPERNLPAALEDYVDDIDMAGTTLDQFAQIVFDERGVASHCGILAEFPETDGRDISVSEAEAMGWRPYATYWPAEKVINWKEGRVNNRTVYTEIRLSEVVSVPSPDDPWTEKQVEQIRVLRLTDPGEYKDQEGNDGGRVYQVVLFRKLKDSVTGKEDWTEVERFIPFFRGKFETTIPMRLPRKIKKAPLTDVAQISLHWYQNSSSMENALHWVGSPTPVFIGDFVDDGDGKVTEVAMGCESGIRMSLGSDAKVLVASGMDLEALSKAMDNKAELAAIAGARILQSDPNGVEAAQTAEIHRAGENSVLASEAIDESSDLEAILAIMTRWAGGEWTKENFYKINTDYDVKGLTPQEALAIAKNWIDGAITSKEKFYLFKKGEYISDDETYEQHESDLESEAEAKEAKAQERAEADLARTAAAVVSGGASK
jgi:hypothetical protein